jgi:hypothetical protein
MLPESIETLERHKHYYEFYVRTGELVSFRIEAQNELLNVYRKEVDGYYHFNRNCPQCIIRFLNTVYKWYLHTEAQQEI